MADSAGGDIFSACCGICCICCTASATTWCNTMAFGSGDRNRQRGCCTACCAKSFDDDAFDAAVARDMQKTRDPNAPLQSTPEMSAKPAPTT